MVGRDSTQSNFSNFILEEKQTDRTNKQQRQQKTQHGAVLADDSVVNNLVFFSQWAQHEQDADKLCFYSVISCF